MEVGGCWVKGPEFQMILILQGIENIYKFVEDARQKLIQSQWCKHGNKCIFS